MHTVFIKIYITFFLKRVNKKKRFIYIAVFQLFTNLLILARPVLLHISI